MDWYIGLLADLCHAITIPYLVIVDFIKEFIFFNQFLGLFVVVCGWYVD